MFLDVVIGRNPALIAAAVELHQAGAIPANSYVLDLDAIERNARAIRVEADRCSLTVFAMVKQIGGNPPAMEAIVRGGIEEFVAVDVDGAYQIVRAGQRLGHVGHLVQVPRAEAGAVAAAQPANWTVFNSEKAREAATAARRQGREQAVLLRVQRDGDRFYPGHAGGFDAARVVDVAAELSAIDGLRVAGVTSFPALLFDPASRKVEATPNLETLRVAADRLRAVGNGYGEINAPGTTSAVTLETLAEAGATQVEPGHGLTGTTPLHAVESLPEDPAVIYLSEVAHSTGGRAYFLGGGLYVDRVFPPYALTALVGRTPDRALATRLPAELPPPEAIDYYGWVDPGGSGSPQVGDSVVLGFRCQAFFTRAHVVPLSGLSAGAPILAGVWTADGRQLVWPPPAGDDPKGSGREIQE